MLKANTVFNPDEAIRDWISEDVTVNICFGTAAKRNLYTLLSKFESGGHIPTHRGEGQYVWRAWLDYAWFNGVLVGRPARRWAPVLAIELFHALRGLRQEGLTILLVEQNVQMALQVSDYAYVLHEGRTVLHGPARQVADNEDVRRAYIGL